MTVTFWSGFSKRINSTLRPSTTGTDHDCKLKENCSEHDPVIVLQSTTNYNYAYIATWGKYYYVADIVSRSNSIFEYHLTEDLLATYRTEIRNTTARVIFAASAVRDPDLIDSRIQIKNSHQKIGATGSGGQIFSGNYYLMTVLSNTNENDSTGIGVTYYLNESAMNKVRQWFTSAAIYDGIQNFFKGNKPIDGVLSLKWIPYSIPSGYLNQINPKVVTIGNQSTVSGTFNSSDTVAIVKGFPVFVVGGLTQSITIPRRYGDFRDYEPYSTAQITFPGVGNVDIKLADWKGSTNIWIGAYVEGITGNLQYMLFDDDGGLLQIINTNVAADCPLGQMSTSGANIMTGIGAAVGGLASIALAGVTGGSSLAIAGGATASIAGVANTVLSCNQHGMSISGGIGGRMASLSSYLDLIVYSVDTEDPTGSAFVSRKGYPYAGTVPLSSFSGFVQCEAASVSCSGNPKEKEEINNYLNSGFYND